MTKGDSRIHFENRLWKAQEGLCAICGHHLLRDERFRDDSGWNLDHVYPRSRYARFGNRGNLLLSHVGCNTVKSDREPTGCEIILLHAINAKIGHELTPAYRSYSDGVKAPSILAEALSQAMAA